VTPGQPVTRILAMLAPLAVWGAQFAFAYAFAALACARGLAGQKLLGAGIVPVAVIAATVLALAAVAALLLRARRQHRRTDEEGHAAEGFLTASTIGFGAFSAAAIVWTAIPMLFVPPCG
jgi:hypothetical protein